MISWGLIWAFSFLFSFPATLSSPKKTKDGVLSKCSVSAGRYSLYTCSFWHIRSTEHVCLCIGHGSSTTVQLGLFSGCSITTISVSTLRAYTYQSECRADGPHSSGPSDVLLRLCLRFKLQYGHMSLTCTALM